MITTRKKFAVNVSQFYNDVNVSHAPTDYESFIAKISRVGKKADKSRIFVCANAQGMRQDEGHRMNWIVNFRMVSQHPLIDMVGHPYVVKRPTKLGS